MTTHIVDQVVLVQEQYRRLMQQMARHFGRTYCAPRFGRVFENQPKVLTRHPYLNYLRHYRMRHPKMSLNRILQAGARAWRQLTPKEKVMYSQKEVLHRFHKRNAQTQAPRVFRSSNKPLSYRRRTLSASKNARNSWRHNLPHRRATRNAGRKQIWQI